MLVLACSLDAFYTYLYTKVIDTSKFQFIKQQQNKTFNYVFLGSSRVVNHINPKIIDSITQRESVNFGVMDAKPKDLYLLVQLLDFYAIQSDTLFIQSDYYYNSNETSNFLYVDLIPYMRENKLITSYFKEEKDFYGLYYFPFYRYSKNNSKLGLREMIVSLNRKNIFEENKGFIPLKGNDGKWQRTLPKKISSAAFYNDSIKNYATLNGKKAIFFTAPFRSDTKNMFFITELKNKFPVFWDFSKQISDPSLFKNGYHLNGEGANKFSMLVANTIISNQ